MVDKNNAPAVPGRHPAAIGSIPAAVGGPAAAGRARVVTDAAGHLGPPLPGAVPFDRSRGVSRAPLPQHAPVTQGKPLR